MTANQDQLPMFLKIDDLKKLLRTSRNGVHEIINKNPDFPILRISEKRIRVPRDQFFTWMESKFKEGA